ncbi:3',5'-cyclic-AMP phosphodiesterase [Affinibrenneria salicis]|uniref:3',5'-cyclic adenosine monophosphate phosphodiesterase CpdA n=1 Tax=Affinibrenneria salicis TaxID=2590031 RepID=A0A5J5FYT9_9GAMM|nr:3',5'-cyclic-AMP phosphodiesterase [Affinibrenneria salicis]KAA8999279.1 3',5'-cyclic-AMP phosphodiesterase [Affinibrenneria salicis]
MESLLTLPVASGARIRILQITDTHLFAGKDETLLGVNTYRSYHAVLNAIVAQQRDYDLVVATGDLAQDHSLQAYRHFASGIRQLPSRCVWLPGNHDFQPAMFGTLADEGIAPSKHVLLGERWQVILLDSQVFGVPHGELSDYQLEWLERCLASQPDRYTLLLLHHHPLPSGCTWLDQHSLRNAHNLAAVLLNYPQVNTVLCGHIHQELDLNWHGRRLLATPSTCVQFKPHCTNFTIDNVGPGWRYLDLLPDGRVETEVFRLAGDEFLPDMDSDGY